MEVTIGKIVVQHRSNGICRRKPGYLIRCWASHRTELSKPPGCSQRDPKVWEQELWLGDPTWGV